MSTDEADAPRKSQNNGYGRPLGRPRWVALEAKGGFPYYYPALPTKDTEYGYGYPSSLHHVPRTS